MDAFKLLFANYNLKFVSSIKSKDLDNVDAVFFGGGSLLIGAPLINEQDLKLLKTKSLFYIGVGIEDSIDPTHLQLLSIAKAVYIRTESKLNDIKKINPNTFFIQDLVYCLSGLVQKVKRDSKKVLIFPNVYCQPKHNEPYWKHASWNYFKSEFSQFVDQLLNDGYNVRFAPMSSNPKEDDRWAISELLAFMTRGSNGLVLPQPNDINVLLNLFSTSGIVITQRFHGIVLAEITNTPYISIAHHDKLKKQSHFSGNFLSYYGLNKKELNEQFNIINTNFSNKLSIKSDIFKRMVSNITSLI